MPAGNGVNCPKCPEKLSGKCSGNDLSCLCYRCPRNLSQCLCEIGRASCRERV